MKINNPNKEVWLSTSWAWTIAPDFHKALESEAAHKKQPYWESQTYTSQGKIRLIGRKPQDHCDDFATTFPLSCKIKYTIKNKM